MQAKEITKLHLPTTNVLYNANYFRMSPWYINIQFGLLVAFNLILTMKQRLFGQQFGKTPTTSKGILQKILGI